MDTCGSDMATKSRGRSKQPRRVRAGAHKPAPSSPQPVYFLSLTLENVRCFGPKQTLRLSDAQGRPARWTVILGNNSSGKTTLLQALTTFEPATLSGQIELPRGILLSQSRVWSPIRHEEGQAHLSTGLQTGNLQETRSAERHQSQAQYEINSQGGGSTWSYEKTDPLLNLVCFGYGATRRMGAGALSVHEGNHSTDSLFIEDMPLRNAEEWLLQADYAASKEQAAQGEASRRRDAIQQLLIGILPDVSALRFAPPKAGNPTSRVEAQTPYGWVAMRSLSLGYRALIAWMVDLASRLFERYPESPNPLAEPAVVLVDEIDLHLHPTWQRQLIGYLTERFPNTQFIVTAHSPLVVQSATDANIVVLRREGDHVVIDNDVESIQGWRVDQILTSDLFGLETARPPQIEEVLKERTALLSKPNLTRKDEARLRELESAIGPLPTGETKTERDALDLIQRAAAHLRDGRK